MIIIELSHNFLWEECRIKTNYKVRPGIEGKCIKESTDHGGHLLLKNMNDLFSVSAVYPRLSIQKRICFQSILNITLTFWHIALKLNTSSLVLHFRADHRIYVRTVSS